MINRGIKVYTSGDVETGDPVIGPIRSAIGTCYRASDISVRSEGGHASFTVVARGGSVEDVKISARDPSLSDALVACVRDALRSLSLPNGALLCRFLFVPET